MATEREYLVSLGLAKESRGRFSKEAIAALETAKSEGMTFDKPVKAEPKPKAEGETKTVSISTTPATPAPNVDAKEVRSWAKANGYEVGDRGRIDRKVIDAFVKAGGKIQPMTTVAKTVAVATPTRPERTGWTFWRRGKGEPSF